jgi:hypothetical protein
MSARGGGAPSPDPDSDGAPPAHPSPRLGPDQACRAWSCLGECPARVRPWSDRGERALGQAVALGPAGPGRGASSSKRPWPALRRDSGPTRPWPARSRMWSPPVERAQTASSASRSLRSVTVLPLCAVQGPLRCVPLPASTRLVGSSPTGGGHRMGPPGAAPWEVSMAAAQPAGEASLRLGPAGPTYLQAAILPSHTACRKSSESSRFDKRFKSIERLSRV